MLHFLFSLWGLGLMTVALLALAAVLLVGGRWRLALIVAGIAAAHLYSGYLFQEGVRDCQARTAAAVAKAKQELQAIADKALADADQRAAADDASLAALQAKVTDYERTLGADPSCRASAADAAHFDGLVPAR